MLPERPKVRAVEAFPVELVKGEKSIVLRDPCGFTDRMIALPPPVFALVALFDGKRTIVDVQAEWARRTGELVFAEQIEGFLHALDEGLFLEGERFERARREIVEGFRRAPVRPAAHAGGAYPSDPAELEAFLGELFTREGGPGRLPGAATAVGPLATSTSTSTSTSTKKGERLVGVVAPHIDPRRGNTAYGHAFDAVARAGGADLYIIFGTAHQGGEDLYIFTKKPFDTPLGRVETDGAFIERLEGRLGRPLDRAELSHRTEHSVEFEVLFLKYVEERLKRGSAPRIVPFLCGSFMPWTETGRSPAGTEEDVRRTIEALRAEIAAEEARGTRVVCIAGADLAHIGIKFGHDRPADEAFKRECEEKDRASLERALAVDGEGFFGYIAAEKDGRNICGLPCIYTMLRVIAGDGPAGEGPRLDCPATRGELLAYGQAPDPVAGSVVSFASLAYYG